MLEALGSLFIFPLFKEKTQEKRAKTVKASISLESLAIGKGDAIHMKLVSFWA